jgi:hypothetical protein
VPNLAELPAAYDLDMASCSYSNTMDSFATVSLKLRNLSGTSMFHTMLDGTNSALAMSLRKTAKLVAEIASIKRKAEEPASSALKAENTKLRERIVGLEKHGQVDLQLKMDSVLYDERRAQQRRVSAEKKVSTLISANELLELQLAELEAKHSEVAAAAATEKAERMVADSSLRRALTKIANLEGKATSNLTALRSEKKLTKEESARVAAVQGQLDEIGVLYQHARHHEADADKLETKLESMSTNLSNLVESVGMQQDCISVPVRTYDGDLSKPHGLASWQQRVRKHLGAVLNGRTTLPGDVELLASVLQHSGEVDERSLPQRLMDTAPFVNLQQRIVEDAVAKVQEHWSARLAVHVWDRCELSRSKMETLRHLLSFIYDPIIDDYVPVKVWVNPRDPAQYVLSAQLASRQRREADFRMLAGACDITVGIAGNCQRDPLSVTEAMYSNFAVAMRSNFSTARPAQPVLYLDATGSSLGRGVTHVEVGSADFDGDAKQSRSTLGPLALYEGSDKNVPLREHLDLVLPAWNQMILKGKMMVNRASVPMRPITSADMQGCKALYGQTSSCHSVWCWCLALKRHLYATSLVDSYEEMLKYITITVGCEFKSEEDMCNLAHYSYGVHRGGAFTKINCACCEYSPTERQWRRDLADFHAGTDADQLEQTKAHNEVGIPAADRLLNKHHNQVLFQPPGVFNGMERAGVDQLHLVYLNIFKALFNYTIHQSMPLSKQKLVRNYFKAHNFYSYDAAAEGEDPVKRWIGREVKAFIESAQSHLPFLLRMASCPPDILDDEIATCVNDQGEIELDDDDDLEVTEEMLEAEEAEEPQMMQHATYWDHFLALVVSIEAPWALGSADTDEYRKGRAVSCFNLAHKVGNSLKECNPDIESWVGHILCFIVPRQMVDLGDPTRRSCDACESIGSTIKKFIKHLTCRRRLGGTHSHSGRGGKKLWKQTLKRGYIQTTFERVCVRATIIHGEDNAEFSQRGDALLKTKGKVATKASKSPGGLDSPGLSILDLISAPSCDTQEVTKVLSH